MSEAALQLDDFNTADLLVDQELGRWTLHRLANGWQRYQIVAEGVYGEDIQLPEPLGFAIPTAHWPRWLP
jgi:hypothetical protein